MPKLEAYNHGYGNSEIAFTPDEGDVRCDAVGTIQRWQNGSWYYIGDLDQLFNKSLQADTRITGLEVFMFEQQAKEEVALHMHQLEQKFDDLKEAGEYLRQLEKMLRVARKAYTDMSKATQEKLKTFERLDVPYPEE